MFPPLPKRKYAIIYADPPWDYKGQKQHAGKGKGDTGGAASHYATVKLEDLKRLRVDRIAADNCLLFMWATSPHLDQAIELGKAWGFQWATVAFVWDKARVNPGFYTMSQCELCLVFKKGSIPKPRGTRNERQYLYSNRDFHSAKPNEIRERIVRMFPTQRRIELFARSKVAEWDAWGEMRSQCSEGSSMKKLRTIVAGSRGVTDYAVVCEAISSCGWEIKTVLSGTAKGVDRLGERWALDNGVPIEKYPADWDRYGKSAGYRRNVMMSQFADALVAVWDGDSRGTKHMIDTAKKAGLRVYVHEV